MVKRFRKRNSIPTELTWEEKNPITYLYSSSDSIERLRRIDVIEKESNTSAAGKKREQNKKK